MLANQALSDQNIIQCLKDNYGIDVLSLTFLPIGADVNASVYKAETRDLSYFIKLKRGHQHDVSIAIVELLHNTGIKEIIFPVKTLDDQPIQRIKDFTLIVYPFIEGQDGFIRSLTDQQWMSLGKALRRVHELEVPSSILSEIRKETFTPKWRDIVRELLIQIEAKPIDDEISEKLSVFMLKNKLIIQRLVDRAEQLAHKLKNDSSKFVLCHSDIHGGNVLIDENNTLYIVDWDEPMMAPKERDLMFMGGGVGNVWNKPHEETLFYKGYGKTEINTTLLAYYRHERIVEDIALYGQDLLLTTAGGEDRAVWYKHFVAMFEPLGVVDMAFKSEEFDI